MTREKRNQRNEKEREERPKGKKKPEGYAPQKKSTHRERRHSKEKEETKGQQANPMPAVVMTNDHPSSMRSPQRPTLTIITDINWSSLIQSPRLQQFPRLPRK